MATFEEFYDLNPIAQIDQNQWDQRIAELVIQFRNAPVVYTPLIDWTDESQMANGAQRTIYTEMLEGDVDVEEIPMTANYIGVTVGVDSRQRSMGSKRYGDKVQLHESQNLFQQWNMNGSRDWKPLLRGLLGMNVIRKHEMLARNAHLLGPKMFHTYAGGGTGFDDLATGDTFDIAVVKDWKLRLGNTGNPVIPGDKANAKLALIPPGVSYDMTKSLIGASANEAALYRDTAMYNGQPLPYGVGSYMGVNFQEVPNDTYGMNSSVLYNAGVIVGQYGVANPIKMGDGAPDPEDTTFLVDDVWAVGQKNVTHYIQLESTATMTDFELNDLVTIHLTRTSYWGVTNGVDPLSGKSITRRVVKIDEANHRLSFDRPILFAYDVPFVATPNDGVAGTYYAFVTKARHVGMCLVLGSRGGIRGKIDRPIKFREPKPIDDFESVWRFVWDEFMGLNLWEPHLWEVHFCAVSLPKPGGVITP